MFNWYRAWQKRRKPCYVIIYDAWDDFSEGYANEEYAGYFDSPEEARWWWTQFAGSGIDTGFQNVKLCLVKEEW